MLSACKRRETRWGWFGASTLAPLTVAAVLATTACGPSKQAYQAQLDENARLNADARARQQQLAAAEAEIARLTGEWERQVALLEQEKQRGMALEQQLKTTAEQAAILERIKARFAALKEKLKELTELGLEVSIRHNKMVISLPGDVLFSPGSDRLSGSGKDVLTKVLTVLRSDKSLAERYYQVAGHTDDQPVVRTANEFRDNWGLSLMRAREVLLFHERRR